VRVSGGTRVQLRPGRARCAYCKVTHVLLPASTPARPADTIRGWIRRVTARAHWLSVQGITTAVAYDSLLEAIRPEVTPLGDALNVLGLAVAAVVRLPGPIPPEPRTRHTETTTATAHLSTSTTAQSSSGTDRTHPHWGRTPVQVRGPGQLIGLGEKNHPSQPGRP
jgi:hypothetical protein